MERLTHKIVYDNEHYQYVFDYNQDVEVGTKLGELEDVLEKYGIENLEEYISALIEARKLAIKEKKTQFKKYIEEVTKREKIEQELAELKQKAIVLPKDLQVGCKIFWANEDGIYSGKLYGVTKDINPNGGFNIWLYCLYNNGLSYSHLIKEFGVRLFATKEEAEQKLAQLKGKE